MVRHNVHASRPAAAMRRRGVVLLLASLISLSMVQTAPAQMSTAFTYQGELKAGGSAYTGSADVQVRLLPGGGEGLQIGPTLLAQDVACQDGRFSLLLNFLQPVPAGAVMELSVRTPHDPTNQAPFTTLSPLQTVTGAPLAYRAQESSLADNATVAANALKLGGQLPSFYQDVSNFTTGTLASGRLSGTYTQGVGFTNPGNAFAGSGAGLTALHAGNIATGTLSPARGGTGSSIASATTGDVLKWTGSAFTPQPETAYVAGAGLSLSGTTFSIADNAITSAMLLNGSVSNLDLASDAASLGKVSGGALTINGGSARLEAIGAPGLTIQSSSFQGSARLSLFDASSGGEGGVLFYAGVGRLFQIGTTNGSNSPFVRAMTVECGSPNVTFPGNVSAASISIAPTTRSIIVPGSAFRPARSNQQYSTYVDLLQNDESIVGVSEFFAPVTVPDGATITEVTMFGLDHSPSTMMVDLKVVTYPSPTHELIARTFSTGDVDGFRSFSSGPVSSTIKTASQSLVLHALMEIASPASSMTLHGVRITYTINSPLP